LKKDRLQIIIIIIII